MGFSFYEDGRLPIAQKVDFISGAKQEVIELLDSQNETIAIARVKHNAATIAANLNTQNFEIAHADDIVLL